MRSLSSAPQLPARQESFLPGDTLIKKGHSDSRFSAGTTRDKSASSSSSGVPKLPARRGSINLAAEKPKDDSRVDSISASSIELPLRRDSFHGADIPTIKEAAYEKEAE